MLSKEIKKELFLNICSYNTIYFPHLFEFTVIYSVFFLLNIIFFDISKIFLLFKINNNFNIYFNTIHF